MVAVGSGGLQTSATRTCQNKLATRASSGVSQGSGLQAVYRKRINAESGEDLVVCNASVRSSSVAPQRTHSERPENALGTRLAAQLAAKPCPLTFPSVSEVYTLSAAAAANERPKSA